MNSAESHLHKQASTTLMHAAVARMRKSYCEQRLSRVSSDFRAHETTKASVLALPWRTPAFAAAPICVGLALPTLMWPRQPSPRPIALDLREELPSPSSTPPFPAPQYLQERLVFYTILHEPS
jgi:hypothetical protein